MGAKEVDIFEAPDIDTSQRNSSELKWTMVEAAKGLGMIGTGESRVKSEKWWEIGEVWINEFEMHFWQSFTCACSSCPPLVCRCGTCRGSSQG
jgi:hypothetical protein